MEFNINGKVVNIVGPTSWKEDKEASMKMWDAKFHTIPKDVLATAVKIIQDNLSDAVKKEVTARFNKHGSHFWIFPDMGHFGFGMGVRNLLRENGLKDNLLPDKNWDDYYVAVIEYALGLKLFDKIDLSKFKSKII